jgi:hypothetical protein
MAMFYECFSEQSRDTEQWVPILATEVRIVPILQVMVLEGRSPSLHEFAFEVAYWLGRTQFLPKGLDTANPVAWLMDFIHVEAEPMLEWILATDNDTRERRGTRGPAVLVERFRECLAASGSFREAVKSGEDLQFTFPETSFEVELKQGLEEFFPWFKG